MTIYYVQYESSSPKISKRQKMIKFWYFKMLFKTQYCKRDKIHTQNQVYIQKGNITTWKK